MDKRFKFELYAFLKITSCSVLAEYIEAKLRFHNDNKDLLRVDCQVAENLREAEVKYCSN